MKFCLVVPEICREICCSCAKEKKEKENTENNNNNNNNNKKKRSKNNKSPKLCLRNLIHLFSPWYSWKIAELALSNNHSLTHYSTLWVRTPLRRGVLDTTLCDKVCQCVSAGMLFSPGTPFSAQIKQIATI
jgi:hypothetical protein